MIRKKIDEITVKGEKITSENVYKCAVHILKATKRSIEKRYLTDATDVLFDMLDDDAHGTLGDLVIEYAFSFKDVDEKGISGMEIKPSQDIITD
jgi:hypothetical protein